MEHKNDNGNNILKFLSDTDNYYLNKNNSKLKKVSECLAQDYCLYHIQELTFEEKAPRKEALENVLSSLRMDGINFIYLIIGDEMGVHFYFGVARDLTDKKDLDMNISDIGKYILKPSINGNFRGSRIDRIESSEKRDIKHKMENMKYYGLLEGVPGINKESEDFQGVDRLVDVMLGDEFCISIVASPLNRDDIVNIENNLYKAYSRISHMAKDVTQGGTSENKGKTTTIGNSDSASEGSSKGTSKSSGTSHNESNSRSESRSNTSGSSNSTSDGSNKSSTLGNNKSVSAGTNSSTSDSTSSSTTDGTSTTNGSSDSSRGTNKSGTTGTSNSSSTGRNRSETTGTSKSETTGTNKSETRGTSKSETTGTSTQSSSGSSKSTNTSESTGTNKSVTRGVSKSTAESLSSTISNGFTKEYINRDVQEWLKYLDDVIIPRLDYGKSKGVFMTTTLIGTNNKANLIKLGNTMKALYSGIEGNKVPLEMHSVENKNYLKYYKNFQIPTWKDDSIEEDEKISRTIISQYIENDKFGFANWLSTNELSLIAGLPQKEVVGVALREEVDFGLNFKNNIKDNDRIRIGKLIQSGNKTKIDVNIDKNNLNKHTFITGVTGSGKTTTCQKLLIDSDLPFMVIEPAKNEYRLLTKKYDDIIIFTLGKESLAPFRLNPFEFYRHENITSRVDMIKACIEASFDMEAAIPQIIEKAIYESYKKLGWNIASNKNTRFKDPFADGVYAFPTISDVIKETEVVVKEQGFDERLKNDYIGSIKARLQGLTIGSKGLMLDTKRSVNFEKLLDKRVILELEEVKSSNEKSLIMGFILLNLNEAIHAKFNKNTDFKHITLVEEAHRLLSRYERGDSLNKKRGIEAFTDMLAEVRKYGESLIIVDQIPNKLTPEILKNTNTKIVHKIFAKDDKEAIGNTMALQEEQKNFMSSLDVGRAIVFTQGWDKALQVQIEPSTNTTEKELISDDIIRRKALEFYRDNYKSGVLLGLEMMDSVPDIDTIEKYFNLIQDEIIPSRCAKIIQNKKGKLELKKHLYSELNIKDLSLVSGYITKLFYKEDDKERIENLNRCVYKFLDYALLKDDEFINLNEMLDGNEICIIRSNSKEWKDYIKE